MNTWRWISLAFWAALLAAWVPWYVKARQRSRFWKVCGVFLLAMLLESIASLFPDTAAGWTLFVLSCLAMVWSFVLVVRDVRIAWREQMERVKHL
jgi:hypothetical protein